MDERSDWEEWFDCWGKYNVRAIFYECNADFSVEDLYQMFKKRFQAETITSNNP